MHACRNEIESRREAWVKKFFQPGNVAKDTALTYIILSCCDSDFESSQFFSFFFEMLLSKIQPAYHARHMCEISVFLLTVAILSSYGVVDMLTTLVHRSENDPQRYFKFLNVFFENEALGQNHKIC